MARINTDTTPVNGIIFFPNGFDGSVQLDGVVWKNLNTQDFRSSTGRNPAWDNCTTCTSSGWETLEKAGCVFLPAAGYRSGSLSGVGTYGGARSQAYRFSRYDSNGHDPAQSSGYAVSVRLVHQIN